MYNNEKKNILNAVPNQYTTLEGQPYVGPYHVTRMGLPMTGTHHTVDSKVLIVDSKNKTVVDTKKDWPATLAKTNNTLNENATTYDLLPIIVNKPPIIISSIIEATTPPIKPYSKADATGEFMYQFPDGTVKVHRGVSITLAVTAKQPDILNVDNGVLVMKESDSELSYQWFFNGELIGDRTVATDSLDIQNIGALRYNPTPNSLAITNVIPEFAGTYACLVSNDIGTTDAGSIELEVYVSDIDSFFYTNLLQNGNGESDTEGWTGVNNGLISKEISISTDGSILKSIVVDPLSPNFSWTTEMMHPQPYNMATGLLKSLDTPAQNAIVMGNSNMWPISTYFSRKNYTYTVNKGIETIRTYQDIDLSELLEPHIRGAIYGVRGLQAVCCGYVGNAIMNYEPNKEFVLPSDRAKPRAYFKGAPRLSPENFSKAGPGFVVERVYVTIQEYVNGQPIKSRLRTQLEDGQVEISRGILVMEDPWSKRLDKYANEVYYPGGLGWANPDVRSLGDARDQHLYVADDLMPYYEDRFTYGQYAEFQKQIIDRLNPKTNKIRVTINIEAPQLGYYLQERGGNNVPTTIDKLWELLPWTSTWPARSYGAKNNDGWPSDDNPFSQIINDKNKEKLPLEQKMPKIGDSRAFVTGLTVALIPQYLNEEVTNQDALEIISEVSNQTQIVESPIVSGEKYRANDYGKRDLELTFKLDTNTATLSIQLIETDPINQVVSLMSYQPGLFPYSDESYQTGVSTNKISATAKDKSGADSNIIKYKGESQTTTNGILIPLYALANSNAIAYGAATNEKYSERIKEPYGPIIYKRGNTSILSVGFDPDVNSFKIEKTSDSETRLLSTRKQTTKSITQLRIGSYKYNAKGEIDRECWALGGLTSSLDDAETDIKSFAPILPYNWYAIPKKDQLSIVRDQMPTTDYTRFSIPSKPLILEDWRSNWEQSMFMGSAIPKIKDSGYSKKGLSLEQTTWSKASRFVITVGAYTPSLLANITGSVVEQTENNPINEALFSYQNYYLDFVEDGAILHQTPNLGGVSRLYSFTDAEKWKPEGGDVINFYNRTEEIAYEQLENTSGRYVPKPTDYAPYINPNYHTFVDDPDNTVTVPIQPVFMPHITSESTTKRISEQISETAAFKLPKQVLTAPINQGGLAIPLNENGEPDMEQHRVIIYGVRPVTSGEGVSMSSDSETIIVNTAVTVTTPFEGEDSDYGYKYTTKQIRTQNI